MGMLFTSNEQTVKGPFGSLHIRLHLRIFLVLRIMSFGLFDIFDFGYVRFLIFQKCGHLWGNLIPALLLGYLFFLRESNFFYCIAPIWTLFWSKLLLKCKIKLQESQFPVFYFIFSNQTQILFDINVKHNFVIKYSFLLLFSNILKANITQNFVIKSFFFLFF